MNVVFVLSGVVTLPLWLLMIVAPGWSVTRRIMGSPWSVAPAALLWTIVLIPQINPVMDLLSSATLERIAALYGTPAGSMLAWTHVGAFDLFVGRWMYHDAQEQGIRPWWIMSALLFLASVFGPLTFLGYLLLREAFIRLSGRE